MNKRKRLVQILAGLMAAIMLLSLVLSLIPTKVSAASSSEIKKQINALKKQKTELQGQIEDVQNQYEENEDEILNMVNQKYAIDQEIGILYEQIDNINQQLSAYALLVADQQDELDEAQGRLNDLNAKNKERIRAMEEDGSVSYWSVLFKANSFSDLLDRLNMIDEIAAADRRRLKQMSEAAEEVAQAQEVLVAEKEEVQQTKDELDATYVQLAEKQAESQEILNELIVKGYELEDLYDQYELEIEQILDDIAMKEAEYEIQKELEWIAYMATYTEPTTAPPATEAPTAAPTTATSPTTATTPSTESSGDGESNTTQSTTQATEAPTEAPTAATTPTQPPSPSSGETWMVPCTYRQFSSPFGQRESPGGVGSTNHQGVDLAGPEGTPIYASKSGTVTVAKSSRSAGNYVTISHGGGYSSIYMHMQYYVVGKGDTVKQGQLIGYMGSTGVVTGTHLHFEMSTGMSMSGTYCKPSGNINTNTSAISYDYSTGVVSGGASTVVTPNAKLTQPTDPDYTSKYKVTNTNAVLVTQVTKGSGVACTHMGMYLYDANGKLLKTHKEKISQTSITPSRTKPYHSWYDVNTEVGYTLTPAPPISISSLVSSMGWK